MPVARLSTTNSILNSPNLKFGDGFSSQRDMVPVPVPVQYQSAQISPPPPVPIPATEAPSPSSKISPAVLFIIVILAVIFFISGLLHLLVRFIIRKQPQNSSSASNQNQQTEISSSEALQRQLQQLFHLHDSGLDQAFIDALPVFLYKEIVGAKEPFDCAVCLCEFSDEDKLRLLPLCGHAFHLNCIDTWLLSNSTCPLCRGALFVPGLTIENPVFEFDDLMEEGRLSCSRDNGFSVSGRKSSEVDAARIGEKLVLPVRLGKFKNVNKRDSGEGQDTNGNSNQNGVVKREEGESSSSSLDARRCYSMGSYQYVLGDANLKVSLCTESKRFGDAGTRVGPRFRGINANSVTNEGMDGKRISASSKGESFSVSKIWQWPNNKGKMPVITTEISSMDSSSLAWTKRSLGDT